MKRSKLGTISATMGIILGCLILVMGVGILSVGYTDIGGLWTKYIAFQQEITDIIVAQTPILVGNEYIVSVTDKIAELFAKVPQNYRLGIIGGTLGLMGIYLIIEGFFCARKKAKKSHLTFAIVDTAILLGLSTVTALLGLGGTELIPLLAIAGITALYAALFPAFKYGSYASFYKRLVQHRGKAITKAKALPVNGASHKSKDRKKAKKKNKIKLTKKQKKLAKLAKKKGGEVSKSGKVLSKPISVNSIKPGQKSGIQIKGAPKKQEAVGASKKGPYQKKKRK